MQILTIPKKFKKSLTLVVLTFFGIISLSQYVSALETATQSQEPLVISEDIFEYVIEGRNDPFFPFISEKSQAAKMDEVLPVENQLTGMQLFEPGQLNLVAIVMIEDNDLAMVEDTTGKGYVLRTGMEIGRRGIVTAIRANTVTIEETAFTRAGKKLTSTIVMLLKKEGEE